MLPLGEPRQSVQDLPVLFLTTACESLIYLNKNFKYKERTQQVF